MKVTTMHSDITIKRTVKIDDGPVVDKEYSRSRLIVDTIDVILTWDGDWTVGHRYDINLNGYIVKKDGTAGQRYTSTYPTAEAWKSGWLTSIVAAITPAVDGILVPRLTGWEVEG